MQGPSSGLPSRAISVERVFISATLSSAGFLSAGSADRPQDRSSNLQFQVPTSMALDVLFSFVSSSPTAAPTMTPSTFQLHTSRPISARPVKPATSVPTTTTFSSASILSALTSVPGSECKWHGENTYMCDQEPIRDSVSKPTMAAACRLPPPFRPAVVICSIPNSSMPRPRGACISGGASTLAPDLACRPSRLAHVSNPFARPMSVVPVSMPEASVSVSTLSTSIPALRFRTTPCELLGLVWISPPPHAIRRRRLRHHR
jgi:hypothetical protein